MFVCELTVLHENHLTHTDLKPENILFVHSDYDVVPGPKRPYGKKVLVSNSSAVYRHFTIGVVAYM